MLRRVLEQMQFTNEGTGGGCNAMTLYKDGHAIVVTIDAMTNFERVSPDLAIDIGVYRTMTPYMWGELGADHYVEVYTQSDAIHAVIDALDYVQRESSNHYAEGAEALATVWTLLEKRHGLRDVCMWEVTPHHIDSDYMPEIQAFITLWDALTGGDGGQSENKGVAQ